MQARQAQHHEAADVMERRYHERTVVVGGQPPADDLVEGGEQDAPVREGNALRTPARTRRVHQEQRVVVAGHRFARGLTAALDERVVALAPVDEDARAAIAEDVLDLVGNQVDVDRRVATSPAFSRRRTSTRGTGAHSAGSTAIRSPGPAPSAARALASRSARPFSVA